MPSVKWGFNVTVYRYNVFWKNHTGTTVSMKPLVLTQVVLSKKNPTQATYKINTTVSFAGLRGIISPTGRVKQLLGTKQQ